MDHRHHHRRHAPRGAAVARISVVVGLAAAAGFVISGDWHGAEQGALAAPAPIECSAASMSPAPYPAL